MLGSESLVEFVRFLSMVNLGEIFMVKGRYK